MSADIKYTRVINNLPKISLNMATTAARIVAKAALDIEANAKARVAVDTGNLKNSIQARKLGDQHWRVTVGAEYGPYVEFGTVNMGPQPYFNPAIDLVIPQFKKAWEKVVAL